MIYFLRAGDEGHIKIGWTKDHSTLERRIKSLQCGQPLALRVIRTLETQRWAEGWLHGFFAGVRATGEWFQYDQRMVEIEPPPHEPPRAEWPRAQTSHIGAHRTRPGRITGTSTQISVRIPTPLYAALVARGPLAQQVVDALRASVADPPMRAADARSTARTALATETPSG